MFDWIVDHYYIFTVGIVLYIGIGSAVARYIEARYRYIWDSDTKFFYSLSLPITFFVLVAFLLGDLGKHLSVIQDRKKESLLQLEKNKLIKYRIEEKQLLQAELELEAELRDSD